jgi:hypothetical protein
MARARRAPFNRQGLKFKTASLQRAAGLFGTAFASSPFEEATTEKVQSRLSFARQTALRGVTAAVVGLLLRAGVDGRNLDEIRLRSRRGGIVCDVIGKVWLSA